MRRLKIITVAGALALAACVTTPRTYEVCDTPNCGDNVTITVEDK